MTAEMVVCIMICWLIITTFLLEAFIVPSGSMAYTLLGSHYEVTCTDCGYLFFCGYDPHAASFQARCPNCGLAHRVDEHASPATQGDRLLVFKQAFHARRPARWDVAVFRRPGMASLNYVKRVVGLPGERVEIRGGDVYIDDQILRKSLHQQRAISLLVHDTDYPSSQLPAPWRSDGFDTEWRSSEEAIVRPLTPGRAWVNVTDWLTYHHYERGLGEVPIRDAHSYNLDVSRPASQLNAVGDLLLAARLLAQGTGQLKFRINDGRNQFEVHLNPREGTAELFENDKSVAQATGTGTLEEISKIEFSLMDRQILFAIDGNLIFEPHHYDQSPGRPSSRPIEIGAQGVGVHIERLQLFRDVYYTDPRQDHLGRSPQGHGWGVGEPYQLGPGEYFMLGDNSVNSEDSRTWPEGPAVPEHLLVGRPLFVHWPSTWAEFRRYPFQVPDFSRIRYIR